MAKICRILREYIPINNLKEEAKMTKNKKTQHPHSAKNGSPKSTTQPKTQHQQEGKFEFSEMILGSKETVEAFNLRLKNKIAKNQRYLDSIDNPNIKWGIPDKRVCRYCGNIWTASTDGFRFANRCNDCSKSLSSI